MSIGIISFVHKKNLVKKQSNMPKYRIGLTPSSDRMFGEWLENQIGWTEKS